MVVAVKWVVGIEGKVVKGVATGEEGKCDGYDEIDRSWQRTGD